MPTADEFVAELFQEDRPMGEMLHAYDPAKAREYYLRTRQLKGRRAGAAQSPPSVKSVSAIVPTNNAAKQAAARKAAAEKRQEETKARVAKLKARLETLEKVLADLVKQAKARSGVEDKSSTKDAKANETNSKNAKPKTAAQKREAAQRSKEFREKNRDPSAPTEAKEIEAKIANVREKIAKMQAEIAAAKKKAAGRTAVEPNSSSQTAAKGR